MSGDSRGTDAGPSTTDRARHAIPPLTCCCQDPVTWSPSEGRLEGGGACMRRENHARDTPDSETVVITTDPQSGVDGPASVSRVSLLSLIPPPSQASQAHRAFPTPYLLFLELGQQSLRLGELRGIKVPSSQFLALGDGRLQIRNAPRVHGSLQSIHTGPSETCNPFAHLLLSRASDMAAQRGPRA